MTIFVYCRDTASETVRTLLVYGYSLDPPTAEAREGIIFLFFTPIYLIV